MNSFYEKLCDHKFEELSTDKLRVLRDWIVRATINYKKAFESFPENTRHTGIDVYQIINPTDVLKILEKLETHLIHLYDEKNNKKTGKTTSSEPKRFNLPNSVVSSPKLCGETKLGKPEPPPLVIITRKEMERLHDPETDY